MLVGCAHEDTHLPTWGAPTHGSQLRLGNHRTLTLPSFDDFVITSAGDDQYYYGPLQMASITMYVLDDLNTTDIAGPKQISACGSRAYFGRFSGNPTALELIVQAKPARWLTARVNPLNASDRAVDPDIASEQTDSSRGVDRAIRSLCVRSTGASDPKNAARTVDVSVDDVVVSLPRIATASGHFTLDHDVPQEYTYEFLPRRVSLVSVAPVVIIDSGENGQLVRDRYISSENYKDSEPISTACGNRGVTLVRDRDYFQGRTRLWILENGRGSVVLQVGDKGGSDVKDFLQHVCVR